MEMKQNQTFSHVTCWNLTQYLFLSKNNEVFQWLSKSKFLSFMTKRNPNNQNERKSVIFPWDIVNFDNKYSFCYKILKYSSDFKNLNFSVLRLKWTETMEMKQNQTFFHWRYLSLTQYLFYQKILKYFNDFQILNFLFLWLKFTQTKEKSQTQAIFHEAYSNLTQYFFYQKLLKYFNDIQTWNFPVLWLNWTQAVETKQN